MNKLINPLAGKTRVNHKRSTRIGSVAEGSAQNNLETVSFTLDNSGGGAAKEYIFGDGLGIFASVSSRTLANPDSGGMDQAILKASFATMPLLLKSIQMRSTVSEAQYSELHQFVKGIRNGSPNVNAWDVDSQSPMDFDGKKKQFDFKIGNQPKIGGDCGIIFTVAAGETVVVKATVQAERS